MAGMNSRKTKKQPKDKKKCIVHLFRGVCCRRVLGEKLIVGHLEKKYLRLQNTLQFFFCTVGAPVTEYGIF